MPAVFLSVVGWHVAAIALEATLEHVVSRVCWIHYPGAARQKGGTGMPLVELLPCQAGMSKANHSLSSFLCATLCTYSKVASICSTSDLMPSATLYDNRRS